MKYNIFIKFLEYIKLIYYKGDESPYKFGVPIVDLTCGLNLAFGIISALYNR